MAVLWPLIRGCVKPKLAASALSVGAALSPWRGVWASGGKTNITATQQGAAPDRPQCCRFSGLLTRLIVGCDWRAAGELGVLSLRAAWSCAILKERKCKGFKMVPVIQQNKWLKWCQARQLDITRARFALETCYYGAGLRSRPGTLLVNDNHIIHFSYSFRDTWWAMFEKSTKIEMSLQQVSVVKKSELSSLLNAAQYHPDAYFQVEMVDKTVHHLILQREGSKFIEALSALGVRVE